MVSAERLRLDEADPGGVPWRRWGPYLSERQWGTVREDYGSGGDTWSYFSHDQARSRAYRWGEDGLAAWDLAFHAVALAVVDGLRQGAARPAAEPPLPAPQRAAAGV